MGKTIEEWKKEILGKTFGYLLVCDIQQRYKKNTYKKDGFSVLCECSCGTKIVTKLYNLLNGDTKSCGCMKKDFIKDNLIKAQVKAKEWRKNNPEKAKDICLENLKCAYRWRQENKEEALMISLRNVTKAQAKAKEWRKEHPEEASLILQKAQDKAKLWRKEYPEKVATVYKESIKKSISRFNQWRKEHPEESKINSKMSIQRALAWQKNHPEEVKQQRSLAIKVAQNKAKEWRKEHPEEVHSHLIEHSSKEEVALFSFLQTLYSNVERQFYLEGHFFDFKIDSFLIEYNGSLYHSFYYSCKDKTKVKVPIRKFCTKSYHQDLRYVALRNNYRLIQIWDYEWIHNKEFIQTLIKEQIKRTANYKDYLNEEGLLNNDYGFNIEGEQIEPKGIWISTGHRRVVNESYSKGKVLIYNSGYIKPN